MISFSIYHIVLTPLKFRVGSNRIFKRIRFISAHVCILLVGFFSIPLDINELASSQCGFTVTALTPQYIKLIIACLNLLIILIILFSVYIYGHIFYKLYNDTPLLQAITSTGINKQLLSFQKRLIFTIFYLSLDTVLKLSHSLLSYFGFITDIQLDLQNNIMYSCIALYANSPLCNAILYTLSTSIAFGDHTRQKQQ